MRWLPSKPVSWIGITLLAATGGILLWVGIERRASQHRVYRIGWSPDPPFQVAGPNGAATGLAIELVRDAARRRGISLEWVRVGSNPDAALRDGNVDLWPLLTLLPERTPYLHITESYLETEHCFLVRAESGFTERRDLAGAVVSFHDLRVNRINLNLAMPTAKLMATSGTDAAIESVCQRRSDAAFVDEYTAISAMLGGLACAGQELLLIATPEIQVRMGVGSTFAAGHAADAIRDEIGKIAGEPNLPPPLLHWSYFSRRHMESLQALREAKKRQQLLIALAAILFSALLIVGWLSQSTLRERRRAKSAEKELDATQRSYRLLIEQAADGVFLVDRNGKFLLVNVRLCEMLGYTREEILCLTVLDTCLPDEREAARLRLENTPCGASLRVERHLRRKDGTTVPIEASIVRLEDGNAQGIVRDITERKRVQQEALARHKLESMGLLAGGIAHDFNNLLGSILMTSEVILSELPEGSPSSEEVRAIKVVADRGAGIVRQMMSYAGQDDPAFERVDLVQVINEMIQLVKVSISKNASLKVDLPADLPVVWANAAQMRQVVMNLVINASEALGEKEGGIARKSVESSNSRVTHSTTPFSA